jgi:hypothetical protein
MASFGGGLALGTVLGVVATEAFKQIGAQLFKRRFEKVEGQRKLIRDDVQSLLGKVDPLLALAVDYYSKPSESGIDTANKLRSGLKSFGMQWNSTNTRITEFGGSRMSLTPLISLRQALTSKLDMTRESALSIEGLELTQIFNAATKVHDELSRVRFLMT